jgi:MFS family permease
VITAYILATTATTQVWGKLGDQYGRKYLFMASIGIFLAGSALSGLSSSMTELIAFRALHYAGATCWPGSPPAWSSRRPGAAPPTRGVQP